MKDFARRTRANLKILLAKEVYFPIQKKIRNTFVGSKKYGGWFVDLKDLNKKSIVYSFGIGEDISFDLDLIKKINCKIYAFDPTPKSLEWLKSQKLPENFNYFKYGIAHYNGGMDFFPPENENYVSHTPIKINNNGNKKPIEVPVYKIKSIMKKFGHNKIDLLKMDIEGGEYKVLENILEDKININQILVEFHHRFPQISAKKTKEAIGKLNRNGYKIFSISPNREEYSLIKIKK